jgi:hypothetical protein
LKIENIVADIGSIENRRIQDICLVMLLLNLKMNIIYRLNLKQNVISGWDVIVVAELVYIMLHHAVVYVVCKAIELYCYFQKLKYALNYIKSNKNENLNGKRWRKRRYTFAKPNDGGFLNSRYFVMILSLDNYSI